MSCADWCLALNCFEKLVCLPIVAYDDTWGVPLPLLIYSGVQVLNSNPSRLRHRVLSYLQIDSYLYLTKIPWEIRLLGTSSIYYLTDSTPSSRLDAGPVGPWSVRTPSDVSMSKVYSCTPQVPYGKPPPSIHPFWEFPSLETEKYCHLVNLPKL